jgi:hypothetical protein
LAYIHKKRDLGSITEEEARASLNPPDYVDIPIPEDLVLSVPAGMADYWPDDMCKPLILGLVFPFINRYPWQLQSTPKMFAMARKMRGLFATKDVAAGNIFSKFLLECKRLRALLQDVVLGVLYFEHRSGVPHFNVGRPAGSKRKKPEGCGQNQNGLGKKKSKQGGLHQS